MQKIKLAICSLMIFSLAACGQNREERVQNELQEALDSPEAQALANEDPELFADYMKEMQDAIEQDETNKDYKLVRELEDSEEDKQAGRNLRGSCNSVQDSSVCIEFYGSVWTEDLIKITCGESAGAFSSEACPRGFLGGCNTGAGTEADMVTWMYSGGEDGITAESVKYAKLACDATMGSKWIAAK